MSFADLFTAVKEAKRLDREYRSIIMQRDKALGRIVDLIGGESFAAIANGERRIGELLTEESA